VLAQLTHIDYLRGEYVLELDDSAQGVLDTATALLIATCCSHAE
jgi:hypothetical protein